jgi:uncharacterized protein involved in exopolysaccharide biosynthesis
MEQNNNTSPERPIIKDDEIDLIALAHTIWDRRRIIYYSVAVALIIGLMVALFSPEKYSASATILPQTEGESDLGGLGGLASMAGINLSSVMGGGTGIQPELYPRVIQSYPFLNDLVHQPFYYEEEAKPVSIYEKELKDTIPGFGASLLKYTIRLPWTIKAAIFPKKEVLYPGVESSGASEIKRMNEEEKEIFESMVEKVTVEVDDETGLATISAEMEEPLLAAQVAQETVELLQKYIIEYKTRQARNNLEFIEARYNEKKAEFEEARAAFFNYRDRNRNIIQERTDMRYQELSDAYNLASQVYQSLAEQREQAEIAVKRDTPAFSIIEPVKIPLEKSAPKRTLIMIVSLFLGGFLGLGIIFGRMMWRKFKAAW